VRGAGQADSNFRDRCPGVTEADITATYKDGVLEIRIPEPKREPANKIAISKS
jgi:hypothetical protein